MSKKIGALKYLTQDLSIAIPQGLIINQIKWKYTKKGNMYQVPQFKQTAEYPNSRKKSHKTRNEIIKNQISITSNQKEYYINTRL